MCLYRYSLETDCAQGTLYHRNFSETGNSTKTRNTQANPSDVKNTNVRLINERYDILTAIVTIAHVSFQSQKLQKGRGPYIININLNRFMFIIYGYIHIHLNRCK